MSTPLGVKTLAAVLLDHLVAHLDPGYEGLGQRHRAARDLLPPPPERPVQFGGVDAVSLTSCPATTMVPPSMTLGGPVRQSVRRRSIKVAMRRRASGYRTLEISGGAYPDWGYRFVQGGRTKLTSAWRRPARRRLDMIEVRRTGDGDLLELEAVVREGEGEARHHVTMVPGGPESADLRQAHARRVPRRGFPVPARPGNPSRQSSAASTRRLSRAISEFEPELPRYLAQF